MKFFTKKIKKISFDRVVRLRNNLFGNRDYKKFVIIAAPRTGSNWLVGLLNSHPDITCMGEKYKNIEKRTSKKIWNEIFAKRKARIKYLGFKLLYNHPQDIPDRYVWEKIKDDPEILIIHLKRKQLLKSYVSLKIGKQTGVWIRTKNGKNRNLELPEKKVNINKDKCDAYFHEVTSFQNKIDLNFPRHTMVNIYYEDLVKDKQRVLDSIFAVMRIKPFEVKSYVERQNPEPLRDLIVNYNELEEEFRGSEWEKYF